ncbi:MAG: hypothetical protein ACI9BF_000021 [Candidatus Paceibacteria bacterium]|jgi:hypothetical protein
MPDITFPIQIFSSVTALISSYAFLMAVLNREPKTVWLRGASSLMLLSSGISFALYYSNLFSSDAYLAFGSAAFLLLTVLISLGIAVVHWYEMRSDTLNYPQNLLLTTKVVAVTSFTTITIHLLLQIASLGWG